MKKKTKRVYEEVHRELRNLEIQAKCLARWVKMTLHHMSDDSSDDSGTSTTRIVRLLIRI